MSSVELCGDEVTLLCESLVTGMQVPNSNVSNVYGGDCDLVKIDI